MSNSCPVLTFLFDLCLKSATCESVCMFRCEIAFADLARCDTHTYIFINVCICIYVYFCIYVYLCLYVYMYICMYVYMHVCMYVYIYIYICICVYVDICKYRCMDIWINIYIYIYIDSICHTVRVRSYTCICIICVNIMSCWKVQIEVSKISRWAITLC